MADRCVDEAPGAVVGRPLSWVMQRRCSLTPRQFGLCFSGLAAVSLIVALAFWAVGAPFVTLFTGVELLVLGAAFGWHALHAADGDHLRVEGRQLRVEQRQGLRQAVMVLDLAGLRVSETATGTLELQSAGRGVCVGRELGAARRHELAADLRRLALN